MNDAYAMFVDLGQKKAEKSIWRTIYQGFAAGFWLSLFGHAALALAGSFWDTSHGTAILVYSSAFPMGLMAILFTKAELFTSNTAVMTIHVMRNGPRALLPFAKNWGCSLVFNLVGSLVVAVAISAPSALLGVKSPAYGMLVAVAHKKLSLTWGEAFSRAVGCNVIVVLAVYVAYMCSSTLEKIVAVIRTYHCQLLYPPHRPH